MSNHNHNMIHKPTCYFEVYERYFNKFIGKNPKVLEIGIGQGGSLKMWREYFGDIKAIHFHNSMVVFEKGLNEAHNTLAIGKATI